MSQGRLPRPRRRPKRQAPVRLAVPRAEPTTRRVQRLARPVQLLLLLQPSSGQRRRRRRLLAAAAALMQQPSAQLQQALVRPAVALALD
jgi:hypothetical protein